MTGAPTPRVALVIDPDPASRLAATRALHSAGFEPSGVASALDGLVALYRGLPELVILSLELPDMTGERALAQISRTAGRAPVVVLAPSREVERLVAAGHDPAHVVAQPIGAAETEQRIAAIAARVSATPPRAAMPWELERADFFSRYELIFRGSEPMRLVEQFVVTAAESDAPVLLEGEAGVGKEQVARAIHYLSRRGAGPWVKLGCASIPTALLESELFGVQGAIGLDGGGPHKQAGRIEMAQGGTLFLDEIGEVPSPAQAKLRRVLEDGAFRSHDGHEPTPVDVRILAATSKNLATLLTAGLFDETLHRRLSVQRLAVPPLRDRRDEIPGLVGHFCEAFSRQFGRPIVALSPSTLRLISRYSWPGNVRELENMIKRFVVLGEEQSLKQELEGRLRALDTRRRTSGPEAAALMPGIGLREIARRAAREAERAAIREVLERVQGNRAAAARLLRISYKTLLHKLAQEQPSRSRARRPRRARTNG